MALISLTGLLTLTVAVYGNFFGSSFPSMSNFQNFPSFPSPFSSSDVFSSPPSFSGFNSFPSFGQSNDFGAQSFGAFPQDSSSGNNVHQTIKLEKNGPDGSKITETIETLGGPESGSTKVNRQSASSSSKSNGNPVKVVHFYGGNRPTLSPSSTQGIAVGEPNPSTPVDQDTEFTSSQSSNDFPSFNDFSSSFSNFNDGFFPSSAGISTAATSASSSNFVTSSSSKTLPDGSTVTETVTYDSKNPGKVTRVIKRIDANGKVTTTTA